MDGMDPTVITEIADYFRREIGYSVPDMTPFVGRNFNVTRAGIHADGLMKDQEIYTIFDTKKLLGKPPTVQIGKASGLAGIAYWINSTFDLQGDEQVSKHDEIVVTMKKWIDEEYEDGRQTILSNKELESMLERLAPGRFSIL